MTYGDVMKKEEIKKYLDTDLEFNVNGRGACFLSSICVVGYDYEGQSLIQLMKLWKLKFLTGKV